VSFFTSKNKQISEKFVIMFGKPILSAQLILMPLKLSEAKKNKKTL
jgi:hypothetical protein